VEREYRAALACLPGMSPLALPRLLGLAGGSRELWNLLCRGGERAEALVGVEKASTWVESTRRIDPASLLASLESRGIRVVLPGEGTLPRALWSIYDPPALLFLRGAEPPAGSPWVAVVGSRRASAYGRRCAEYLGRELASRGTVVVSGAAHGIDRCAHEGCLQGGGFTAAVLGCGIDQVYPAHHRDLYERIAARGCLISEYPPGEAPLPWRFPHRNRLIAGLAQAVVVVEASEKSGALITAEFALEEGREVMAVPGPIDNPLSRGTHGLIQKGAKLVSCVEDVLEEIFAPRLLEPLSLPPRDGGVSAPVCGKVPTESDFPSAGTAHTPGVGHRWGPLPEDARAPGETMHPLAGEGRRVDAALPSLANGAMTDDEEAALVDLLRDGEKSLDWLAARSGKSAGRLLVVITRMQLKGLIREEAGGKYGLAAVMPTKINNNKFY